MIVRWMADGELEDDYGEFFIVENSSENYWNSHTLRSVNRFNTNYIITYYTWC